MGHEEDIQIRVEIGFGVGWDKHGKIVGNVEDKLSDILADASRVFGGAALFPVQGGWVNGRGEYVREGGYILRIDNVPPEKLPLAEDFALDVKSALQQESVVFSISSVDTRFI